MKTSKTTMRDRTMFAIALAPPVALVLFCMSAAAKWHSDEARIRPMLEQSISAELIDSPSALAANYATRTSKEKTRRYRELTYALGAVNENYRELLSAFDKQNSEHPERRWFEWEKGEFPYDSFIDDYLADARPVLDAIESLKPNQSEVWLPNTFGNPNSGHWGGSIEFIDLLRIEFRDAVRAGETERALRAVRVYRDLDVWPITNSRYDLLDSLRDSFATGVWSEAEIDELVDFVIGLPDLDREWESNMRSLVHNNVSWLTKGIADQDWRPDPIPILYAPSRRLEWLDRQQRLMNVGSIGTVRAIKKVGKIQNEQYREETSKLDTSLQFPIYGQFRNAGSSRRYIAASYANAANVRRNVRTAAALAMFKLKFGSYPESLKELAKVGLPARQTLDPAGRPFWYESDGATCMLGNASTWFTERTYSMVAMELVDDILSSIVRDYGTITFR